MDNEKEELDELSKYIERQQETPIERIQALAGIVVKEDERVTENVVEEDSESESESSKNG